MNLDIVVTEFVNHHAGEYSLVDSLMIGVTGIGIPLMVCLVAFQWWVQSDRLHIRHTCLSSGLAFLLGLASNQLILIFVHRLRPYDSGLTHLIIAPSKDWSFPSDHATAAFAIATGFFMNRVYRRAIALTVLAFLISISRIYVGTHYFSDVAGGAIVGLLASIVIKLTFSEGSALDQRLKSIF